MARRKFEVSKSTIISQRRFVFSAFVAYDKCGKTLSLAWAGCLGFYFKIFCPYKMQHESKRKRIPGIHSYIAVINELRQELGKVTGAINELRDKISAVYKQEKENSPKNNLYKKLDELSVEIKGLKDSRAKAFDEKNEVLGAYGDVKNELHPEKGRNKRPLTADEIDARMKEINLNLISHKHDTKAEKDFEAEVESLRRQKRDIGALEQKTRMALEMKGKLDVLSGEIKELNQRIGQRQTVVDGIKAELKEINDQNKTKNPAVDGYEKSIQGLKNRKNELSEKIRIQQEEIRKKEIEHDRFLEEMSLAQALEKQKEELKQKIGRLEEQKNDLFEEKAKFDPSKFDSVIFGIERLDLSGKKISLPINLALHLSQYKIPLPVCASQVKPTVDLLRTQKEKFAGQVLEKQKEFESKISDLDKKISEEKKTLFGMPPTDVRLLKFRRD